MGYGVPYIKNSKETNQKIGYIICESSINEELKDIKPKLIMDDRYNGRVVGEGILQRANKKNRNGRFYDSKDLFPQLACPRSKELLKSGWGAENGHPMAKDLTRQQTIDPNNIVAYFLKLWTDGDFVMANFIGSNLPIGKAFDEDLRMGFLPAWSLRALGSVENTSRGAEVKGIKIITWDRVYYPSHPEAYTKGIVNESAGNYDITSSGIYVPTTPNPTADKSMHENGLLAPIVNQDILSYIQQESCNYKRIINEFEVLYDRIELINEGRQVQLTSKTGNVFVVYLEDYIHNEILDFCSSRF